jgi:hypothetical protein
MRESGEIFNALTLSKADVVWKNRRESLYLSKPLGDRAD